MNDSVIQKQSSETKNCQAARETSRPLSTASQRNSTVPKVKSHLKPPHDGETTTFISIDM